MRRFQSLYVKIWYQLIWEIKLQIMENPEEFHCKVAEFRKEIFYIICYFWSKIPNTNLINNRMDSFLFKRFGKIKRNYWEMILEDKESHIVWSKNNRISIMDFPFLNPNCFLLRRLFSVINHHKRFEIIVSNTFAQQEFNEIGRYDWIFVLSLLGFKIGITILVL